jgi:hypothetical protein
MFRSNVYLTEKQEKEIKRIALHAQRPKAVVLRELIEYGLQARPEHGNGIDSFMQLGELAAKYKGKVSGPKDLSQNLDRYTWDE